MHSISVGQTGLSNSELWRLGTDGTMVQVADINPGADGSSPTFFTEFNGALYFEADNPTPALWRVTFGRFSRIGCEH